ncbi:MAG: response regulator [Proteobacteria bacterium]|nr:response regulator [Pseudomonadota bacterium]MBU4326372.1 response regulator [Pseudomonadota bacterium]
MNEKILVVDDEPEILETISEFLSEQGFRVTTAASGEEAITCLAADSFPLMITDMKMPGMTGLGLLKFAKQMDKDIEVIVLTGYGTMENAIDVLKGNGAYDYLRKPLEEIDDLSFAVTHALAARELRLENKVLSQQLHKSFEEIEDLYNHAPCGYHSLDKDGIICRINDTELAWLGYTRDEVIGKLKWINLITPASQPVFWNNYPILKKQGFIRDIEYEILRKDGTVFIGLLNSSAIYDSNGDYVMSRSTIFDITERKQAETQLVKAKEEWEQTFDAIADIITIQDEDMHIVRANKATHDFFQARYGELNGKHCYELFAGASEPCSKCPLLATIQDRGKHSTIIRHENLGKFFHVSSSAVLADNGDIQYLIHVAKDITEQKKQEELAKQISRDQEQLKHFESLRTMAGAIAHRFNNAMMGVLGNLEFMLETLPDNSQEKEMGSDALQAAKQASLVGSMMLTYLGQRPLRLQLSSLTDFAGECATELKKQMDPSISLKVISPPAPLYCSMDKEQIKEVLTNILINASESLNNEAGEIEISFGADHFDVASFPVVFQGNDTKEGLYIFCQIRDTGQGISAENLQRLFEPFFTTKFVGRGLGLALSVGIMRLHHGAVLVESKPDAGTTVRILLPGMEQSQKEITSPAGSKKNVVKLSGDILFADDDGSIRNLGKRMLEALGFTIHTAVNGLEAVEMVRRQDINYRAVILDISMPEMDGMEAMREIKKSNPDLPILLSSGYSAKDFPFEKDLATKPDGFLQKPFLFSDLQQSLEKLLT